jgi:hypothetical protein
VSATPYNSSGSAVTATVTFTLDGGAQISPAISVSPTGAVCAGSWDATYTLCTPARPAQIGSYKIVATANGATAKETVFIHYHVDAVYLSGPTSACTSSGKTGGVSAVACTTVADAGGSCGASTTSSACTTNGMCDITDSVGGFSYAALDSSVVSFADATKPTFTAGTPGITKLYASVSSGNGGTSTVSTAVPYTTCLVDSISLHVASKTDTSFSVAKSATTSLAADVLDTSGTSITPSLTFNSLQAAAGTVSGSNTTGTYSGVAPGYGQVVASCTPPNCNKNASAVFSNVVNATVTNSSSDSTVTANETNVYVTGVGGVQMYPVDSTKFTLGTLLSLPYPANSMVITRDGKRIFIGSDNFAMVVDTASNAIESLSFAGRALAASPNNAYVLFSDPTSGLVNVLSVSSLTVANTGGFTVPGVDAATFTPDGNTVYFASGSNLYRYRVVGDAGSTPLPLTLTPGGAPLPATAQDIMTSANGTVLFSSTTPRIVADETCNANPGNGQYIAAFEPLGGQNFTAPTMLSAIPNGSGMLAVDGTHLDEVTITTPNPLNAPFAGCPATGFATSPSTISLSALGAGFTVNQLVMSNSGRYAAVLTGCSGGGCTPQVGIIDLTTNTLTPVTLVDKGTSALTQVYSGDFLLDDSGLWVGADDSYIHFIDVTKLQDTQQVQVQIQGPSSGSTLTYVNPSLVAVQRK